MKIAFLCHSLSPGRDGVGDYVRQLADACTEAGHVCRIVALHDHQVAPGERREAPDQTRLSATLPWTHRAVVLEEIMRDFAPHWVSWQIVPYGFHPKGVLPPVMARFAQSVRHWRQHVMLHELWIGLARSESLRARLVGAWQRRRLLAFLARVRPARLHTSNRSYQAALARCGWSAEILPLFGNIPVNPVDRASAEAHLVALAGRPIPPQPRSLGVLFGTIHPQWHAGSTIEWLRAAAATTGRQLVLLSVGRAGAFGDALFSALAGDPAVPAIRLGMLTTSEISLVLRAADFGLATHPWALLAKSGSTIAMLEHGLPVLAPRDDWQLRGQAAPEAMAEPLLARTWELTPGGFAAWLANRRVPAPRLPAVSAQFVAALGEPVVRSPALA